MWGGVGGGGGEGGCKPWVTICIKQIIGPVNTNIENCLLVYLIVFGRVAYVPCAERSLIIIPINRGGESHINL